MVEDFHLLLEEHSLMADFRGCFAALTGGKFEFTTSCSYRTYKRFFSIVHQVFGPFIAAVSFDEDYSPEGCGYNTTVNLEVDEGGNYVFALLNVLCARDGTRPSEELERRRHRSDAPFEANCRERGNISAWIKTSPQ
jgi:hypothetical protein